MESESALTELAESLLIAFIIALKVTVLCLLFLWPSSSQGWSIGDVLMSPVVLLTHVLDRWNVVLAFAAFWTAAAAVQLLAFFVATFSIRYLLRRRGPGSR